MRRAIVTSAATVSGVILLLSLKPHDETTTTARNAISAGTDGSESSSSASASSSSPSPSSTSTSSTSSSGSSSAASKTVTGDSIDTRWGPVQVRITVKGKKITDISVIRYPSDNPRDQEINSYALPVLNQEALSAQSAQIDAVSGATFTSDGYTQSLQSAIDKAGL